MPFSETHIEEFSPTLALETEEVKHQMDAHTFLPVMNARNFWRWKNADGCCPLALESMSKHFRWYYVWHKLKVPHWFRFRWFLSSKHQVHIASFRSSIS